ncbi:MAG: HD domain-containing phosphohydrolase [Thermodesulfobacteriota bacterium]
MESSATADQPISLLDGSDSRTFSIVVRDLFEIMDEMLANRDHYTFEHAIRVAEISRRIGARQGLTPRELEIIELGCLVHDIGKIAIPDDVLLKPGRFDREDREIMELHPQIGANLFAQRLKEDSLTDIIRSHHERLDGSGYPRGIRGDEISGLVRIVSVADVYEALVAMRPYKRPFSRETAIRILREEAENKRLDERAVETLVSVTAEWDPLAIQRDFAGGYMGKLESFRYKTYFKEPLSDFYNYRYLLTLDAKQMLETCGNHYHIIMIDFRQLRLFNQRYGYVRADELLNEIGNDLHLFTKRTNEQIEGGGERIILVRKGADYLLYSCCSDEHLRHLLGEVRERLDHARQQWNLDARLVDKTYPAGFPVEKALNELFVTEEG